MEYVWSMYGVSMEYVWSIFEGRTDEKRRNSEGSEPVTDLQRLWNGATTDLRRGRVG